MMFQVPLRDPFVIIDLDSYDTHEGIDFPVPSGTQVIAARPGTVVRASSHKSSTSQSGIPGDFGNVVAIDHGEGIYSIYAHLSSFDVSFGQNVNTGDNVGKSGNTGLTFGQTGNHLHFSIVQLPSFYSISAIGETFFVLDEKHPDFLALSEEQKNEKRGKTESYFSLTSTLAEIQNIAPNFVDTIPSDFTTPIHLVDNGSVNQWTFSNAIEYGEFILNGSTSVETDWVKFTATQGEAYSIRVTGTNFNDIDPLEDTFFRIRDSNGNPVGGTNTDAHDDVFGRDAAISDWTPENTGDYFISIGSGGTTHLHGGYELIINRENQQVASDQGINLISGLGGTAGFGEQVLPANDDSSTGFIDISSIFENGINFFGRQFSGLWVNNNGSVTFNGPRSTYTPDVITSVSNNPEITPYFADVDTRGGAASPTPGGNSTGSNLVYYDFDAVGDRFIVTWDDVGYYSHHTDKLNAFQLILTDQGNGDFDIEFRYEDVNWTTGDFSGGSGGLGGTVARAGYTAGTGDPSSFFELPASGDQSDMLALDETQGNTGDVGRWEFKVRSGDVVTSNIPPLPPIGWNGWTSGDPHISTLDGVGYDFQAAGEFVMLRGISDPSFEIQARMVPIGNNVSVNAAVATNLGGMAVMVDAQDANPFSIDGIATSIDNFSFVDVGNDRVFREDNTYTIVYAGADGVVNAGDSRLIVDVWNNRVDIDMRLNTELAGDLQGLLGDADGNPDNDIALADGTVLNRPLAFDDLYGQFRDDWRVSDIADSLFTYDTGESLANFYQSAYPSSLVTLDDLDPAVRSAAEQAVQNAGVNPGTANFNNAVLDYALTGDISFITSAVNAPVISESSVVTVTPPSTPQHNIITGTGNSDYLVGTDDADMIHSLGGSYDRSAGGPGADIFVFGAEVLNGIRERDVIMDYEVGIDAIMLEDGATVGSVRQTSTGAIVFLEGDLDAIYVQGENVLPGNLTFLPENLLLA